MVDQVSLPTSYSNCSKKLEKSKHVHKMDRLSQKGQFKLNWRFLANAVLLLTHAEVFSPNRWVIVFSFNTIHSIITVHKCSSPSPGNQPTWQSEHGDELICGMVDWCPWRTQRISFMILGWAEGVGTARCVALEEEHQESFIILWKVAI